MGSFSPIHWLILLSFALPVFPIWHILKRLGLSPALALLYFLPIGGLIALWVLAYARWPALPNAADGF